MNRLKDRFYFSRRQYATHNLRKKYPLPDMKGWLNAADYTIEFHFDERKVFNEVINSLSSKFPWNVESKIHFGKDEKALTIFISSKKALKFLIKKYKLLIQ